MVARAQQALEQHIERNCDIGCKNNAARIREMKQPAELFSRIQNDLGGGISRCIPAAVYIAADVVNIVRHGARHLLWLWIGGGRIVKIDALHHYTAFHFGAAQVHAFFIYCTMSATANSIYIENFYM